MSHQHATPELRQWIVEQAQNGQTPEAVLAAMRASGWQEAVALQAMEKALRTRLEQEVPLPDVRLLNGASSIWAHDRSVQLLMRIQRPPVLVLGGFLSDVECDAFMAAAEPRLSRSETVVVETGGSAVHEARTSQGMFFGRGESELCQRVEARIAALLNWPVEHGEGLQVLRYGPGAQYKPHHDYFDPEHAGTPAILKRGGQRVGTLLMYLNTPEGGGATVFPDLGLSVEAVRGQAVFFAYGTPTPASLSLHGGAPVTQGEKWVATKWLRQNIFE